MRLIHKEQLKNTAEPQSFNVPYRSKIIKFDLQDGNMMIWIEKPAGVPKETHYIELKLQIFGTGFAEIPDGANHIDTIQAGPYVWHLYQLAV